PLDGPQVDFMNLPDITTIATFKDAQNYVARCKAMGRYMDVEIANLRSGLKKGRTVSVQPLSTALEELQALNGKPVEEWPLAQPELGGPSPARPGRGGAQPQGAERPRQEGARHRRRRAHPEEAQERPGDALQERGRGRGQGASGAGAGPRGDPALLWITPEGRLRGQGDGNARGAQLDNRVLPQPRRRRLATRLLHDQHLSAHHAAALRGRGAGVPRVDPRASPADRDRAGAHRGARVAEAPGR